MIFGNSGFFKLIVWIFGFWKNTNRKACKKKVFYDFEKIFVADPRFRWTRFSFCAPAPLVAYLWFSLWYHAGKEQLVEVRQQEYCRYFCGKNLKTNFRLDFSGFPRFCLYNVPHIFCNKRSNYNKRTWRYAPRQLHWWRLYRKVDSVPCRNWVVKWNFRCLSLPYWFQEWLEDGEETPPEIIEFIGNFVKYKVYIM